MARALVVSVTSPARGNKARPRFPNDGSKRADDMSSRGSSGSIQARTASQQGAIAARLDVEVGDERAALRWYRWRTNSRRSFIVGSEGNLRVYSVYQRTGPAVKM